MLQTSPRRPSATKFGLLLLTFALVFALSGCGDSGKTTKVPKIAPDFTLTTLDGQTITRDGLKGKVVLLDFWATWCPPCRAAIPHLVKLYEKYKDQGLVVVGISLDKGNRKNVVDFIKRNRVPYPISVAPDNPIVKDMGNISSLPTLIMLDRKSEIAFKVIGFNQEIGERLEQSLLKQLKAE